jgi:hypothetical protein
MGASLFRAIAVGLLQDKMICAYQLPYMGISCGNLISAHTQYVLFETIFEDTEGVNRSHKSKDQTIHLLKEKEQKDKQ